MTKKVKGQNAMKMRGVRMEDALWKKLSNESKAKGNVGASEIARQRIEKSYSVSKKNY